MSESKLNTIHQMDALQYLRQCEGDSVHCMITSPPYYGLRDYGVDGQMGLEESLHEFIDKMAELFREARRVLRPDGTLWLNMGDSYANDTKWGGKSTGIQDYIPGASGNRRRRSTGLKSKDLMGQPWRLAFALQDDGWYLRSDIIWSKPNPMPESVKDRPTKAHEYVFLLTKSARYWYDADAIREDSSPTNNRGNRRGFRGHGDYANTTAFNGVARGGNAIVGNDGNPTGRNKRSVWTVATKPMSAAHFATFPEDLIKPMILAGCPKNGIVLDCFMGAGTTALVAQKNHRNFMGCELNPEYIEIANARLQGRVKEHKAIKAGKPHTVHMFEAGERE